MSPEQEEILWCRIENLATEAHALRLAVVAVLSHAIRRQHLPPGLTFDSVLWDRLLEVGGPEACAAVTNEIEHVQSMLRQTCGREGGKK